MSISIATYDDVPAIVSLLNSAYRGDASKAGWTTEADMISGELRTDETTLLELMRTPGAVFLKFVNKNNHIIGCVFLHKRESRMYLGMLSVSPMLQAKGIGKQLMNAALGHAIQQQCSSIFMRVISLRHELIAWYERQGYKKTGEREPFPNDERFGVPMEPLEFVIMETLIGTNKS